MMVGGNMPPIHSGYQSSPEKNVVRDHFDLPLLERFSAGKGTKLAYFGMPGEECLDIRSWRTVLREVVAIERYKKNLTKMEDRLKKRFRDISSSVYHGDADDIILSGLGKKRTISGKPARTRVANGFDVDLDCGVWKFDVVYLDYFGPFLPQLSDRYPDARRKRPRALRHLFEQERLDARDSWLLLLTVEGGEYPQEDTHHLAQYVEGARRREDTELSEAIDFLLAADGSTSDPMIKLVHGAMGLFVSSAASHAQLVARPNGTVSYSGSSGKLMVHCAFQLERSDEFLGPFGDPLPLLRAPIIRPVLGEQSPRFEWAKDPCPGTTKESVRDCLDFLAADGLDLLLADVAE